MRRRAGASNKKRSKKTGASKTKSVPKRSLAEVLAAADQIMSSSMDVESAAQLYSEAASLLRQGKGDSSIATRDTDLVQVLEKLGECKVSLGDQEGARKDFEDALALLDEKCSREMDSLLYHERRSNLFLYIGQLCMDRDALEAYHKGIQSLESAVTLAAEAHDGDATMEVDASATSGGNLLSVLRQKLSGAYCTVAELYLTDLCFEDNAETECESHLEKALKLHDVDGEPFVDALQTMASLRLSQKSKQMDAISYISKAYGKMKVGCEALATLVGLGEDQDDDVASKPDEAMELQDVDAANNLPEFEFRCQTAKLLLECTSLLEETASSERDQCLSAAISVLGSLLAQDDEVVEIWFLTGCAFTMKSPPVVDAAQYYLQRTKEMLEQVRKSAEQQLQFADDGEADEIREELAENQVQLDDVQAKLDSLPESEEMED
eukprot:Nitzschia sp. Nitz4//scaffold29_size155292//29231//30541//NITZ4_002641-RA/size155292-processed-gene-0.7-mRNA-1//1//CDS//3329546397//8684//frame0